MDLRYDEVIYTGLIWLRIGTSGHGNETSGSIKFWIILEKLHNRRIFKQDSAAGS
jgi:hypothetical protein